MGSQEQVSLDDIDIKLKDARQTILGHRGGGEDISDTIDGMIDLCPAIDREYRGDVKNKTRKYLDDLEQHGPEVPEKPIRSFLKEAKAAKRIQKGFPPSRG